MVVSLASSARLGRLFASHGGFREHRRRASLRLRRLRLERGEPRRLLRRLRLRVGGARSRRRRLERDATTFLLRLATVLLRLARVRLGATRRVVSSSSILLERARGDRVSLVDGASFGASAIRAKRLLGVAGFGLLGGARGGGVALRGGAGERVVTSSRVLFLGDGGDGVAHLAHLELGVVYQSGVRRVVRFRIATVVVREWARRRRGEVVDGGRGRGGAARVGVRVPLGGGGVERGAHRRHLGVDVAPVARGVVVVV